MQSLLHATHSKKRLVLLLKTMDGELVSNKKKYVLTVRVMILAS
jgi:hypothetical protein